ncbi:MAG: hypothetical protein AAF389_09720 [Gemmatimonadota bacterium]
MRDLSDWLTDRCGLLADRWIRDVLRREQSPPEVRIRIVGRFARLIVRVLPMMLGPHRNELRPAWDRAAELYGAVGAKRGLAAGEVIEEFHLLRELVIRELYADAPLDGSTAWPMREVLRLNRALDRAVTHASIGHTDTLFFDFFGPDTGRSILGSDDVAAEAELQLEQLTAEIREHFGAAFADTDAASEH